MTSTFAMRASAASLCPSSPRRSTQPIPSGAWRRSATLTMYMVAGAARASLCAHVHVHVHCAVHCNGAPHGARFVHRTRTASDPACCCMAAALLIAWDVVKPNPTQSLTPNCSPPCCSDSSDGPDRGALPKEQGDPAQGAPLAPRHRTLPARARQQVESEVLVVPQLASLACWAGPRILATLHTRKTPLGRPGPNGEAAGRP